MKKIIYSVIGGGWRAEFYLRIAALIPDRFKVACIYIRNPQTADIISAKYDVNVVRSLEELKKIPCDFFVNCIDKNNISFLSLKLADEGYAVLSETPACVDKKSAEIILNKYNSKMKIQIAEQFKLKPMYQAVKKITDSGILGEINYIYVSAAHEYHAMSLIRFFLGCDNGTVVSETGFNPTVLHTNFRYGEEEKEYRKSKQVIKIFDFGGKTAVYDFDSEQYFSPIRTDRLVIRGTRGEIVGNNVRYFNENDEYIESKIVRSRSGNLDGFFYGNISFENKIVYKSPFPSARISDEETAIAVNLEKMAEYVKSGTDFYNVCSAVRDVALWNNFKVFEK